MKFRFRLKSVLNIKIQTESIKKTELGQALTVLDMENKKLNFLVSKLNNYINEYKEWLNKSQSAAEIRSFNIYLTKQKEKIEIQKENVNKAKESVDRIRQELIRVSKEKEMLEKLQEKKKLIFNEMELKEEQKIIDEIISYKHNVKPVEAG